MSPHEDAIEMTVAAGVNLKDDPPAADNVALVEVGVDVDPALESKTSLPMQSPQDPHRDATALVAEFPVAKLLLLAGLYALFGLALTMPGSALPEIKSVYGVGNDTAGLVFALAFLGMLVTTFVLMLPEQVLSRFIGKSPHHAKRVVLIGLAIVASSFAVMAAIQDSLGIAFFFFMWFVAGVGFCCLDLAGNLVVSDMQLEKANAAFTLLHMGFGSGSMATPFIYTGLLHLNGTYVPYQLLIVALCVLSFVVVWLTQFLSPVIVMRRQQAEEALERASSGSASAASGMAYLKVLWSSVGYWLIVISILVYNASELIIGGWMFSLVEEEGGSETSCALATTLFWAGLTVGRLVLGLLSERLPSLHGPIRASTVVVFASSFSAGIALLLVIDPFQPTVFLWSFGSGFALAPIFPLIVSFTAALYFDPADGSTTFPIGGIVVFADIGGLVFPPLVGLLAEEWTIRYGLLVAVAALLMLVGTVASFKILARRTRLYDRVKHH